MHQWMRSEVIYLISMALRNDPKTCSKCKSNYLTSCYGKVTLQMRKLKCILLPLNKTVIFFSKCSLRCPITVFSIVKHSYVNGSVLLLLISYCYNNGINQMPYHWSTSCYYFLALSGHHNNRITR